MDKELVRLASFQHCAQMTVAAGAVPRLSRLGFYYSRQNTSIICHRCQLQIEARRTVDEILEEHGQRSADCHRSMSSSDETRQRLDAGNTELSYRARQRQHQPRQIPAAAAASSSSQSIDRSRPDFNLLRSETVRLGTFYDWASRAAGRAAVDVSELARAGLFYTGHSDRVQCAFCRGILRGWVEGHRPADEHRLHFPACPFVLGRDLGTVGNDERNAVERRTGAELRPNSEATSENRLSPMAAANGEETGESSQQRLDGNHEPRHGQYSDETSRINSFTAGGRVGQGQTAQSLANAGFFYVGPDDNVRCFQCDGGLKNWRPGDDPWTEHARWFPRCPFLLANKSSSFINEVRRQTNSVSRLPVSRRTLSDTNNTATSGETWTTLEENRQLREARTCKVCMDRVVDTVFLPCGHLVCCSICSPELRNCPICRTLIRGTVKIFPT